MSDFRLTLLSCGILVLILLLALVYLVAILTRLQSNLLVDQTIENQRLRNQLLAMGDLPALERLNRTTGVERPNPNSLNSEPKVTDPNSIRNTPTGPMLEVPNGDGTINLVPLMDLEPGLAGMGWDGNPDLDAESYVNPNGDYRAGPNAG